MIIFILGERKGEKRNDAQIQQEVTYGTGGCDGSAFDFAAIFRD